MKKLLLLLLGFLILAVKTTPMIVLSGSMQPYMNPGDVVLVYRGNDSLKKGDVITFKVHLKKDVYVTHRIVGFKDSRIVTKGDNNRGEDDFNVTSKNVVGKPVFLLPLAGYLFDAIRRNGVKSYVITVLIPSAYIIASELTSKREGRKKRRIRIFYAKKFFSLLVLFTGVSYAIASPYAAGVMNLKCVEFVNSTTGYTLGRNGISEIVPVFWTVSASRISPVLPYLVPLAISVTLTLLAYPLWYYPRGDRR